MIDRLEKKDEDAIFFNKYCLEHKFHIIEPELERLIELVAKKCAEGMHENDARKQALNEVFLINVDEIRIN